MFNLKFELTAKKQLRILQKNKQLLLRIKILLEDIVVHPQSGLGKPEPLKHELRGYWSRRIDKKNRLIYKIIEPDVIIISLLGHYE